MKKLFFLIILFFSSFSYGAEEPPKTGNFALPTSQQPGPLVSFGQHIVDKNNTLLYLFVDKFGGVGKQYVDVVPGILYGITNDWSIFLSTPIAASHTQNGKHSAGFGDAFLQIENAFYTKKTSSFIDQATIVGSITAPTGSTKKNPPTGVGSPSLFLGATYSRMYTDWFYFTSHGVTLTTTHHNTKFGNSFLYQFGFGRNLVNINHWIFAWMIETTGQYSQRNRIHGVTDMNSGGNIVYVTPSLWASSKKLIFQFGVGFPVTQNLYGNQKRENYLLIANVGWTF